MGNQISDIAGMCARQLARRACPATPHVFAPHTFPVLSSSAHFGLQQADTTGRQDRSAAWFLEMHPHKGGASIALRGAARRTRDAEFMPKRPQRRSSVCEACCICCRA